MVAQVKIEKVNKLKEEFKDKTHFIFADYKGLSVAKISTLKGNLKKAGVKFRVFKNTLAKRAFDELGIKIDKNVFTASTSVATFGDDVDILKPIKIFDEFIKTDNNPLKVKFVLFGNQIVSESDFKLMAKLPSREILLSKLVGSLKMPITKLCWILNGVSSKLILVIKEIEKKKATGG